MHISSQFHVRWPQADSLKLAIVGLFTWRELANTKLFFLEGMLLNIYQHTTGWALRMETRACWEMRVAGLGTAGLTSLPLWLRWSHSRRKANTGTNIGKTVAESTNWQVGWPLQAKSKLGSLKYSFCLAPNCFGRREASACSRCRPGLSWELKKCQQAPPMVKTGPFLMKSYDPF